MLKTSYLNEHQKPLVISPDGGRNFAAALGTVTANREFLREALLEHGALLFRGFEIDDVSQFRHFVRSFSGRRLLNYAGGVSPRRPLASHIYSSTEYPPDLTLSLHNELSYSSAYPSHLYLCCLVPARKGGETTIGDSRRILKRVDPSLTAFMNRKTICYLRHLSPHRGSG